ncbi:MAG: tRNA (adenosine(37)-N6)-threonylcarbamoyltransferase complex transferase subunit TsaD [bacterium]
MRILAIETSCDDTAIAIIEANGGLKRPVFKVLSNLTHSQIELHAKWSGVVPFLAKREHSINLVPLLETSLINAHLLNSSKKEMDFPAEIEEMLKREPELFKALKLLIPKIIKPKIDAIAVTFGPGLEPALWTGINLAKALSFIWKIPVISINHMEGHLLSSLVDEKNNSRKIIFPAVGLLVSGGHTELVLIKDWFKYKILGATRDDAAGEAFDKVARMIGLAYPGGPKISKLAEEFDQTKKTGIVFPRPMIRSKDFDFSFSGLKTSVLYKVKELGTLTDDIKKEISHEFENSVIETLGTKTKKALIKHKAKTLIVGGGVSANTKLRNSLIGIVKKDFIDVSLLIPEKNLSVDNAVMIGIAGYLRSVKNKPKFDWKKISKIKANGNLVLK